MYYLHKVLPVFLSPIFVVFLLVIVGALTSNKKVCILAACLLYIFSTPFFANESIRFVEGYAVKRHVSEVSNAEAIIVLGGMLTTAPTKEKSSLEWMDPDRFFAGVDLFKAGKAPKLIFTENEYQKEFAISMGIPESSITLTNKVRNTEDEAKAIKQLLLQEGSRIILVTSAFHMDRALILFEWAGFEVEPYPVDFKVKPKRKYDLMEFLPDSEALVNTSLAMREAIGRLYYKLHTRTTNP